MAECCKEGPRGPRGLQGERGIQGVQGVQGIQGEPGLTGPTGANGIQGVQGEQGIQGEPGPAGLNGINGAPGTPGVNGSNGTDGEPGPQGDQGEPGDSAYQVWLSLGNTGTEQDFIDSLEGAMGPQGPVGGTMLWSIDVNVGVHTIFPNPNTGLIMRNTGFATVRLPLNVFLGTRVRIAGTIEGTGGWKISMQAGQTVEMSSPTNVLVTTTGTGEIIFSASNYSDSVELVAIDGNSGDGLRWAIISGVFAGNVLPTFT